jgi:NADPH:quinone reductase-like Zn-dependent oxidoreductase
MGVVDVFIGVPQLDRADESGLAALVAKKPFDAVIDPYADLYFALAMQVLGPRGHYATCGLLNQGPNAGTIGFDWSTALATAIMKNLTIHANCLGTAAQLDAALSDWVEDRATAQIDSVHGGYDAHEFLWRTFVEPDRFGKVVYCYSTD